MQVPEVRARDLLRGLLGKVARVAHAEDAELVVHFKVFLQVF